MKAKNIEINGVRIEKPLLPGLPRNRCIGGYACENRKKHNLAEVVFWKQVHQGKFHGIDFTRQLVIGNYIADFCVRDLGLVVEVDGGYHDRHRDEDAQRDAYMRSLGLQVFRVSDYDVLHNRAGSWSGSLSSTTGWPMPDGCWPSPVGAGEGTTPPFGHPSLKEGNVSGSLTSAGRRCVLLRQPSPV